MIPLPWVDLLELLSPRVLPALAATAVLGLAALAKGSVSGSGALGGLIVGVLFWLTGEAPIWCLLAVFFVSSSLLGLPARRRRPRVEDKHERGGRRSWHQVAANTGPMVVAALGLPAASLAGAEALHAALTVSIVAGFAAAASDTWAGEIGVLSRRPPRLLWGGKSVEAGQSGGVSVLGLVGAATGALSLATLGLVAGIGLQGLIVAAAWGFGASLVDSLLGATVQALYQDADGRWTERPVSHGRANALVRGWRWMNNDVVNAVSVTFAVVGAFLSFSLGRG